ncbi:hypothetical protein FJY84_08230 [Candidatus Bathyarchaeota archaeon]|nr:hypothetical protein [Candidatus Bathyarchaeota archaeon]
MKKSIKIILTIVGILIAIFAIILFPLPESLSWQVDNSVLLEYHRVGGFAGFMDTIKILNDGSVEFNNSRDIFTTKLSDEDLQTLTQFIESKEYSLRTKSLLAKWTEPTCCDLMYTAYLINKDGKTIMISHDKRMSDIIQNIDEEANSKLYNITE